MAFDYSQVAGTLRCWRRVGLTSFPFVPSLAAARQKGLGTLYPPEVIWERCEGNDLHILTSCRLATALPQKGENKRELFYRYDGSDESSHYISHTLYPSDPSISCSWNLN